ncbi:Basic leucine zipper and W2 domain-containing protein 1 [Lamellibrachia satsuma]|nr:Basic leucine zipper and W2 domain-containing protein 1 [Lamellibrachia satsuma]
MSQKGEKPTLSGQRIKTRKRDEKEKYDPNTFRDAILQGLTEAGTDLDQVSRYLDSAGSKLNYRRYAETFFDILFAGGILAPGGSLVEEAEVQRASACIFAAPNDYKSLRAYYEVLYKLIRRYKYLEKSFTDELRKLLLFLKGFTEEERIKLGTVIGICLANGLGEPTCLPALFEEHLVKEGLSLELATVLFRTWLKEKDMSSLASGLKKANIETKLLELLPHSKKSMASFEDHFKNAGLEQVVVYQRAKMNSEMKKGLQKQLKEMVHEDEPIKEIMIMVKEHMTRLNMAEHEVVIMVWNCLVDAVEWNKKEELVAEQALKHLRTYSPLLASLTTSGRSEIALIQKVQEYCYDNMSFMKVFQRIILLFYKAEVVSEDAILKWYKEAHLTKGKSVFLEQMKKFVEWLENAEEESEEDD